VLDLSTPAAPVEIASISTQARALGLDVEGTLCAVTTDGKGVRLFDIATPAAPAAQGAVPTPATAYAVDLQGIGDANSSGLGVARSARCWPASGEFQRRKGRGGASPNERERQGVRRRAEQGEE
jgi:hypothetical protein